MRTRVLAISFLLCPQNIDYYVLYFKSFDDTRNIKYILDVRDLYLVPQSYRMIKCIDSTFSIIDFENLSYFQVFMSANAWLWQDKYVCFDN
jgi:hypothetical protein